MPLRAQDPQRSANRKPSYNRGVVLVLVCSNFFFLYRTSEQAQQIQLLRVSSEELLTRQEEENHAHLEKLHYLKLQLQNKFNAEKQNLLRIHELEMAK